MPLAVDHLVLRTRSVDVPFGQCSLLDPKTGLPPEPGVEGVWTPDTDPVSGAPLGSVLTVTYAPGKVTNRVIKSLTNDVDGAISFLCAIVTAWDLTLTADGPTVPVTQDALDDVETEILGRIVETIQADTSVDPTKSPN